MSVSQSVQPNVKLRWLSDHSSAEKRKKRAPSSHRTWSLEGESLQWAGAAHAGSSKQNRQENLDCVGGVIIHPWTVTAGYAKTNLPAATTLLPAERDYGVRNRYRAGRYSPTLLIKRPTDIWISPLENCRFHSPPLLVVPVVCLSPSAECSSHRALHSHDAARSILGQPLTVNVSSVYR